MATSVMPQMLTIRETSNQSGLSYDFIRKLCMQNKIVHVRAGSKYYINFDRFVEYLNKGDGQKEFDKNK